MVSTDIPPAWFRFIVHQRYPFYSILFIFQRSNNTLSLSASNLVFRRMIWLWKQLGLAYDLKQFRQNEIDKGRVQQLQKKLDQRRAKLDWGVPLDQLPALSWDEYVAAARRPGTALVAIAGVIHDVADFVADHPGGRSLIASAVGKDATAIFNGGVYEHSNAAHNLLSTMRVGVLRGGGEVEIWKRAPSEKAAVADLVHDLAGRRILRAGGQVTRINLPYDKAVAA